MAWLGQQRGRQSTGKARVSFAEIEEAVAPLRISMYDEAPQGEVAIEEFERFALDRLKVLKGIEDAKAKGKKQDDIQALALELVRTHLKGASRDAGRWRDQVSHFVLRLAFCRSEDLRRWYLAQECELFRLRFRDELPTDQVAFIRQQKLGFQTLEAAEFEELRPLLVKVEQAQGNRDFAAFLQQGNPTDAFFKVEFERVPDLVTQRKVLLRKGWAYVSRYETASLVGGHFRAKLSQALNATARRWTAHLAADEADRLTPIVESLSTRYLGSDYGDGDFTNREVVLAAQLPTLARQSFPLCMQSMFNHVREQHHMHHQGRLQLGLFLKGIGLPLEEAMRFWRAEFAPKCPGDGFEKKYAYNVRYNYGKEGRKSDYTPYSCLKIISSQPGKDQAHGCPYKVWNAQQLTAALSSMRLAPSAVQEAVAKARGGHFQLACAAAFEGAHRCECVTGINHPNQYFDESRKALAAQQEQQQQQQESQGAGTPIASGRPPATPATQLRAPMRTLPAAGPASAPPKMTA